MTHTKRPFKLLPNIPYVILCEGRDEEMFLRYYIEYLVNKKLVPDTFNIINLGGNVAVIGGKPDGTSFKIGVQDPFGETGEIIGMIELEDVSLISSGNYERYFEQDGVRYHHILDPDSGAPAEAGLSAVTVLTEKGIDGDALSTSVFLLGAEEGLELVKSIEGAEALLVDADGTITMTDGLKEKWTAYE